MVLNLGLQVLDAKPSVIFPTLTIRESTLTNFHSSFLLPPIQEKWRWGREERGVFGERY